MWGTLAYLTSAGWGAEVRVEAVFRAAWGVSEGLPVDSVSDILIDKTGFVWVATWDGLLRFDGISFQPVEPASGQGWPSHRIVQIQQARDGAIWAQTEQGDLVRIDTSGALEVFDVGASGRAHPLIEDSQGRWLIVCDDGLKRLEGGVFERVAPEIFSRDRPTDLALGGDGAVWALTSDGLLYRIEESSVRPHPFAGGPAKGSARQLRARPGGWWIGTDSGVFSLEGDKASPLTSGGAPWAPVVRGLQPASGGALWVGTREGLQLWQDGAAREIVAEPPLRTPGRGFFAADARGHTWLSSGRSVLRDGARVFSLPEGGDATIVDIEVDSYGSAWVATDGEGLHQLIPPRIEVIGAGPDGQLPNVYAVAAEADGSLWFGSTVAGASWLGPGGISHLGPDEGFRSEARSFARDRSGVLWIGQRKHGLLRLSPEGLQREEAIPDAPVLALLLRSDGTLLVGSETGLWVKGDRVEPVAGVPRGVRALAEDERGIVWIGTLRDGLWRLSPEGPRQIEIGSRSIRSLLPDGLGGVWVGTEDMGLRHSGAGAPITTADGLPSRTVHALLRDREGSVWGSTNRGLFRISGPALAARAQGSRAPLWIGVLTERDGLRDAEGNGGSGHAGAILPDGRLLFSTQAGIAVVDPALIGATSVPPPLSIGGLEIDGARRSLEEQLTLAPHERSFRIDLHVLGLRDPQRASARWRLDGIDPDWIDAGSLREARYTDIPPGSYTFHLDGADADGTKAAQEIVAHIVVQPWLHETLAVRAALLAALALALGLAYRARLAGMRQRQRELEAIVEARTALLEAEKSNLERSQQVISEQAARLVEADRLKTRYFANLSHELRTPLTLILGPLQDVREGLHGPVAEDAAAQIARAERSARDLFDLVNQMLDIVKIDAGKLELSREVFDLSALVRSVSDGFRPLAARQGLLLEVDLPDTVVPVYVDARELAKVIGNLLSNAVKFTPRGGQIALSVAHEGESAQMIVSDTGCGISEDGLRRIFDRFFSSPGPASGLQPSTGLGLALAREIVEMHGGTLTAQSKLGEGSTFTVALPIAPGEVRALPKPKSAPEGGEPLDREPPSGRTTVLVVDDHADLRRWIAEQLSPRYRTLEATDGLSALSLAREELPDIIITDLMMPGMDGNDLVRALRADPDLSSVPVVLLSARGSPESQIEGLERGADLYLVKPFSPSVLRAQIDSLLARHHRLRQELGSRRPEETPEEELSADERYLRAVRAAIEAGHSSPDFGVQELAEAMHQDRAHLFRRIKALTGQAPSDLIRTARLERAARLLARRAGTVSEIAYAAGFSSLSSFSTSFRQHFGVAPSKYAG